MYTPSSFRETRLEVLHGLIRAYPFATVVVQGPSGLVANHMPFEVTSEALLHGHVACGNELATMDGALVLLVFNGPDGYVSPNWYPSKHVTGREVPTWNYAVAHVHGRLKVIADPGWMRQFLVTLTDHHEADQPIPWHLDDAPAEHIEKSLRAIVGIAVTVDRIEGKFKLSQNHPLANQIGVVEGLHQRNGDGDAELAQLMVDTREEKA